MIPAPLRPPFFPLRGLHFLGWLLLGAVLVTSAAAKDAPGKTREIPLTLEDITELRNLALSPAVEFDKRVKTASFLTQFFELMKPSRNAHRFCLDFYSSIYTKLEPAPGGADPALQGPPFTDFVNAINQGKRRETAQAIIRQIQKGEGQEPPHPAYMVLALKADHMLTAYKVFYNDLSRQKISPYAFYFLGIVAARETRFIEAERFFEQAAGQMGSPLLERWLALDRAKILIVNGNLDEAQTLINGLLHTNPQDPQALNMLIFHSLEKKQYDGARQYLARLEPLLYADPYLITESVKWALILNEFAWAARILEQYAPQVEPTRDFYDIFSLVRAKQGKQEEANQLEQKARRLDGSRGSAALIGDELKKTLDAYRQKRRREIEGLKGIDSLTKVYLYLLHNDVANATAALTTRNGGKGPEAYEKFVLAAILRRNRLYREAVQALREVQKADPAFRPCQVLALLTDLSFRAGDAQSARAYAAELAKSFPDSYPGTVARRIPQTPAADAAKELRPVNVSSLMSRYDQYSAPFLLAEIRGHWGDAIAFATLNSWLGTSPRRGLFFHEFLKVVRIGTRYRLEPFVGTADAVLEFLRQDVPVIFCQGEMFNSQRVNTLTLIAGAAPDRGVFYAEGVTPSEPALYTEPELLEGICFAVYPKTLNPVLSPATKKAMERGAEFIQINEQAFNIQSKPDYDARLFTQRKQSILQETGAGALPHKLAFARWVIRNQTPGAAKEYLDALRPSCQESAHYWFLSAVMESRRKNIARAQACLDEALKRSPDNTRFLLSQGLIYYQSNELAQALQLAERLRDQFPEDPTVSAHLMLLYDKANDPEKKKAEENRLKNLIHVENVQIDLDPDQSAAPLGRP
ncbi:MAG: tetratricopeptide repeat protein [bacterium]